MKNLLIVCLILSSFPLFAQKKESKDAGKIAFDMISVFLFPDL